jgi:multidrug efflux pump
VSGTRTLWQGGGSSLSCAGYVRGTRRPTTEPALPRWRLGANALAVAKAVYAKLDELSAGFLQGVKYTPVWDPTVFVRHSIKAVQETLIEAVVLVVLVVILFLQTWRASVIPLIAVPVSVVGTFAWLYVLGYSINTLTLFGLVLAIGIVVDDAIVVVENVERNIARGG